MATDQKSLSGWALILGASSGFGAAISRALAQAGMNIVGVHLDFKKTLPKAKEVETDIEAAGQKAIFVNMNAADDERRASLIERLKEEDIQVKVLVHSLAFGSLKAFVADSPDESLNRKQIEMTQDVMANSLIYWVQDLVWNNLFADDARVFAMTSEGSHRVMPSYGAVGGAKALLEAYIRQLAVELAPRNIKCTAIQAGVTDTPALRVIPGHEEAIEMTLRRNPYKRLTTPEDVARAITALSHPNLSWMSGDVVRIDGGEDVVAS